MHVWFSRHLIKLNSGHLRRSRTTPSALSPKSLSFSFRHIAMGVFLRDSLKESTTEKMFNTLMSFPDGCVSLSCVLILSGNIQLDCSRARKTYGGRKGGTFLKYCPFWNTDTHTLVFLHTLHTWELRTTDQLPAVLRAANWWYDPGHDYWGFGNYL